MANLTGFFNSPAGNVNVTITDAHSAAQMRITGLGEIVYEFDLVPDTPSIDRIAALYSTVDVSLYLYDTEGNDLYDRLVNTTANPVTITADLNDGTTAYFRFIQRPQDVTIDEQTKIVKVKCSPFVTNSTVGQIFANANYSADICVFGREDATPITPNVYDYQAMPAGRFIKNVMSEFTAGATTFQSATANAAGFSEFVFQDVAGEAITNGTAINSNAFFILDINSAAGFSTVTLANGTAVLPENVPAIELVKQLAVAEGSVLGAGFDNFYRYRANVEARSLSYSDTLDLKFSQGFQALRYIFERAQSVTFGNSGTSRRIPALTNANANAALNPDAQKFAQFILEPAYPFLSVGLIDNAAGIVDGNNVNALAVPTLVNVGVSAYQKALPASGAFVVEGRVRGVNKLRPYDAIEFDSTVPERYQNKTFRSTYLSYNFVSDEVKFKAYEL